jgi:hypothetical protein
MVPGWQLAISMAMVGATFTFARSTAANTLYRNLGNWKFEDITEPGRRRLCGLALNGRRIC